MHEEPNFQSIQLSNCSTTSSCLPSGTRRCFFTELATDYDAWVIHNWIYPANRKSHPRLVLTFLLAEKIARITPEEAEAMPEWG